MEQQDHMTSRDILFEIGKTISTERERQGLTLDSVSQRLRILESHLADIEAGNLDNLPAMTYVIGYVRSYARLLGLDDAKLCSDLKNSLSTAEDKPEFDFVENRLDSKNGAGRVALVAVIVGILIYGGWYSISLVSSPTPQNVAESVTQTPVEETVLTKEEPVDIEPELVEVAPRNDETSTQVAGISSEIQNEEINQLPLKEETNQINEANSELTASVVQTDEVEVEADKPSVTEAIAVNRTPETEIIIEAIANSWVEVTRADGSSVTSRLMRLGDTYLIPTNEDLFLTTGNAGGLNIRMGKADPFTLGSWGEALRELPLNKAVISERY